MRSVIQAKLGGYAIGLGTILCSVACTTLLRDQYTPAKWIATYLTATLAWGFLVLRGTSLNFLRPFRKPLVALLVAYGIGVLLFPQRTYRGQVLDWIAFSGLAFAAFECFRLAPRAFVNTLFGSVFVSTALVLTYGLLQFFAIEPFPELFHNSFPSSFFGFQNMTAEFMGYSILTQAFLLFHGEKKSRSVRTFLGALLGLSLFYLFTLHCRAVYVALLPALAIIGYFGIPPRFRKQAVLALGALWIVIGMAVSIPLLLSKPETDDLYRVKMENARLRITRWANTALMIVDQPLGFGPGTYEFAYLPYHSRWRFDHEVTEGMLARSPHNEYLRITAENGVFFAAALLVLGLFFITRLYRNWRVRHSPETLWVAAALAFTAIEAIFAFPMEDAFPFLIVAVAIGVGCALFSEASQSPSTHATRNRLCLFPAALVCTLLTLAFANSKYVEANLPNDPEALRFACESFPPNWRPCVRFAEISIARKRLDDAEAALRESLRQAPNHFMALRFLSFILFEKKEFTEGCAMLARYDSLFRGQYHALREGFLKLCPARN